MTTVTIPLDETRLQQLEYAAQQAGRSVEDVIQQSIDDYLARRREFTKAADYVLNKNAELYRRLAK